MDIIDIGLYASYLLIILCTISAVVIPIAQSFGSPETLVKSGIGLAVVVVVFLVGYLIADGTSDVASEATAKLVGAGIITMYIFLVLALVGIVYTEISKMIK
ncbi:hypothetical protein [Marinoscillum sp. MHG1-6]|uniref:hypothetical protein n=1 Tax=Marinoscillum sp. MHG1-6 TaxID=2959627 RepID=UPI0021584E55|nr:hypothetical protein [Marinoscillum sp. MHG1-6]